MDYADRTIDQFLAAVASESAAPAGGSVSAVVGAAGAALCEMVCIHTIERDGEAGAETELADVHDELRERRRHLLALADADAEAVSELLRVLHEDGGQVEAKRAIGVPLAIAEACSAVLERSTVVAEKGTPNAAPDAITGAFLAHAALRAAVFTVRTNLGHVEDAAFVDEMCRRTADVERSADDAYEQVLARAERFR